ncbi:MAG TPA: TROVE domain-containing protein, partial [Verrucomicrobiae bacterium]|nr:TROVE domain-containing protein [Verrucomicrobiae bacterium]
MTPQSEPIPGTNQVPNSAGGYAWQVDDWTRLDRFLVLGAEGGAYYIGERDLVKQNHTAIVRCIHADGLRVVNRIVEISDSGRAPKNDPAIFALALVATHGDAAAKAHAFANLGKVCRIGTHLFHFAEYVNAMRGWGRGLRNAVGKWYVAREANDLAHQAVKYQSRDGWSHSDLLRLAHPVAPSPEHDAVFRWMLKGADALGEREIKRKVNGEDRVAKYGAVGALPKLIDAFESAKRASDVTQIVKLIDEFDLPRECIPTQWLNEVRVWDALLQRMPMTAMIRNLGKMSAIGLLTPFSDAQKLILAKLRDEKALKRARIHPLAVLIAQKIYAQGHGDKGSLKWSPVAAIIDALDAAFYATFSNVEPIDKPVLLALDVSGSMGCSIAGSCLSAREASAAMALVTAATESEYHIMGFSNRFMPLKISPRMRLDDAVQSISNLPFEGTDCALPMLWAAKNNVNVSA